MVTLIISEACAGCFNLNLPSRVTASVIPGKHCSKETKDLFDVGVHVAVSKFVRSFVRSFVCTFVRSSVISGKLNTERFRGPQAATGGPHRSWQGLERAYSDKSSFLVGKLNNIA